MLDDLVNREAGLLGVSGVSADMRDGHRLLEGALRGPTRDKRLDLDSMNQLEKADGIRAMEHKDFRIVGLAGSLRRASFHRGTVRAANEVAPERMSCEGFDLGRIPYFDQDVENRGDPEPVEELGEKVRACDAVLIATPEYDPEGLTTHPLSPEAASWLSEGGMALLTYEEARNNASPTQILLEFMESAYQAGAKSAGWDIEALRTRPPAREAAKLNRDG